MKNKKLLLILAFVLICALIVVVFINLPKKEETGTTTEITPSEEITEEQERQTMIALYYTNIETNTLVPEARVIDAKSLLENPYKTLTEYVIEAPRNEKLKSSIPEGTKINGASLNGNTVTLDLSKEFLNGQNEENAILSIYSIVNTLTELNEVNSVRILIDGEENISIEGTNISLSEGFNRFAT